MRPRRRAELAARVDRLEQRVEDVEHSSDLTMASDLLDDLAQRVGELSLTVPAQEDLLDLRLHTARVAIELARVAAELHAAVDRLTVETNDDIATVATAVESLRAAVGDLTGDGHGAAPRVLRRA